MILYRPYLLAYVDDGDLDGAGVELVKPLCGSKFSTAQHREVPKLLPYGRLLSNVYACQWR